MNTSSAIFKKINSLSFLSICTILFLTVFLVYLNTFANGLFYDDEDFIYKNEFVKTFNIGALFSENLIAGAGKISNYYRPILGITFALEHLFFGLSPFIYHFTNTILQTIATILIFLLVYKLFENKVIAFLTALLFGIHPIQTEAIAYASGRGDPLSMVFMILTILFSFSKKKSRFFMSFVFLILALLSKELVLITPGLIFVSHMVSHKLLSRDTVLKSLKTSLPYFGISFFYFFLRLTVLNFQNTLNFYSGDNIYTQNILIRINTFFNLVPEYISLLLYPHTLFIERPSTIYTSVTHWTVLIPIFSLIILFFGIKYFKKFPISLFSLLWFYISFIPTSGILPINGIFYEHFVYFPSIGFFLLFSWGAFFIIQKVVPTFQYLIIFFLISLLLLLSLRTIARNAEWNNPITFYNQTLSHSQSSRLYNNLAMAYAEEGDSQKAIETYKRAITLGDFYPQTHYNIANAYTQLGDLKQAEEEYKKAVKIDPTFYLAYIKLFEIYKSTNDKKQQEWVIEEVEKLSVQNKDFEPLLQQLKSIE